MAFTGFASVFLSAVNPFLKGIGEDRLLLKLSFCRAILTISVILSVTFYCKEVVAVAYSVGFVQFLMLLITCSILCSKVKDGFLFVFIEFKGVIAGFLFLFIISVPVNQFVSSYFDSIVSSAVISGFIVFITTLLFLPIIAKSDWLVVKAWLKVKFR